MKNAVLFCRYLNTFFYDWLFSELRTENFPENLSDNDLRNIKWLTDRNIEIITYLKSISFLMVYRSLFKNYSWEPGSFSLRVGVFEE